MDEIEWLACTDPTPMLAFLRGKASDRKLRLFAAACCRDLDSPELTAHRMIDAAERYADGRVTRQELQHLRFNLGALGGYSSAWAGNNAVGALLNLDAQEAAAGASSFAATYSYFRVVEAVDEATVELQQAALALKQRSQLWQVILLRDIIGNPLRSVAADPRWRTSTAVSLARAIYAERAFDRLPILADALEDAGCDSAELLAHLRSDSPHARGCWAVDLVLGKQ